MKKLRIQKMPYINQGTANTKLKGVKEFHAIFKFDTDKEAEDFIKKVNEWWHTLEGVGEKMITALNKFKDEQKTQAVEESAKKKPGPQKGKGGRPPKADIQG